MQKAEEQEVRAAAGFQDECKEMDGRKEVSLNLQVLSCVRSQWIEGQGLKGPRSCILSLVFFWRKTEKKKKSCKEWINSVPSHQQFTAFKCFKNSFARKNCFYLHEFTVRDCLCIKAELTSHTHEFSGCCFGQLEIQAFASLFNRPLLRHTTHSIECSKLATRTYNSDSQHHTCAKEAMGKWTKRKCHR